VFARRQPLAKRPPFDTSQPCFFLKQEKTLVFQKNQEKDVWHALLSFQGTGPRGLLPADDAVPPAFSQDQISVRRRKLLIYVISPTSVNGLDARCGHHSTERGTEIKNLEPLRGCEI
jgi:hypothetical protein